MSYFVLDDAVVVPACFDCQNTFASLFLSFFDFRDFFTWLFQPGKEQLEVLVAIAIPTIQGLVSLLVLSSWRCVGWLDSSFRKIFFHPFHPSFSQSIFEKWPDRLSLRTASGHHQLKLETEARYSFGKLNCPQIYQKVICDCGRMVFFNWWLHLGHPGKLLGMQLSRSSS